MLRFCLTRQPNYMECNGDKAAIRLSVLASVHEVTFNNMTPGEWSLLLIHDSNQNGKLDKRFGIPREGFGFSGNPPIRFGPPSASDVHFEVPAGLSRQNIRMRYIF